MASTSSLLVPATAQEEVASAPACWSCNCNHLSTAELEAQGWHLRDAVQRIWAGARDVAGLVAGLDDKAALLVQQVVEML